MYKINGASLAQFDNCYGDGVHDDTLALQKIIDNNASVIIPEPMKFRITASLIIDLSKVHYFDGGGSSLFVDGSFSAIILSGTCETGTADPSSQTEQVLELEAGFIFKNLKIIGNNKYNAQNFQQSKGITVSKCFNVTITECYITQVETGILVTNRNRNIIISNNHIYNITGAGIKFDETVNLHQCNVVGNMIQYCKYCFEIQQSQQIANFQLSGNDIEIAAYPTADRLSQRGIYIESGDTNAGQLSEIVITGNTIQGHSLSQCIIEINGGNNRQIRFVSIVGNHISNTQQTLINLKKVINASISNNTFFTDNSKAESYAIDLKDCKAVAINGNACSYMGHLVKTSNNTVSVSVNGNASYQFDNYTVQNTEEEQTVIDNGNTIVQIN